MTDIDPKLAKRMAYAQGYGADDVMVARNVGQYPPPDFLAARLALVSPPPTPPELQTPVGVLQWPRVSREEG